MKLFLQSLIMIFLSDHCLVKKGKPLTKNEIFEKIFNALPKWRKLHGDETEEEIKKRKEEKFEEAFDEIKFLFLQISIPKIKNGEIHFGLSSDHIELFNNLNQTPNTHDISRN